MRIVKIGKYENGMKYVEFDDGYNTPYPKLGQFGEITYEWRSTWRIVEDELPIRIADMKKKNEDTSLEERALEMMKELP